MIIMGAQLSRQLKAILPWQANVKEDDGDALSMQDAPHLLPVVRDQNIVALSRKITLETGAGDQVVIDNQQLDRVFQGVYGSDYCVLAC